MAWRDLPDLTHAPLILRGEVEALVDMLPRRAAVIGALDQCVEDATVCCRVDTAVPSVVADRMRAPPKVVVCALPGTAVGAAPEEKETLTSAGHHQYIAGTRT